MIQYAVRRPWKPPSEFVETVEEATLKARLRIARPDSARDLREAREQAAMIAEMQAQAAAGTLSEIGRRLLDAHLRVDAETAQGHT